MSSLKQQETFFSVALTNEARAESRLAANSYERNRLPSLWLPPIIDPLKIINELLVPISPEENRSTNSVTNPLTDSLSPTREGRFFKEYEGEQAIQLRERIKTLVQEKHFIWKDNDLNVVGFSGIDLDKGLSTTQQNVYGDTLAFVGQDRVLLTRATTKPGSVRSQPKCFDFNHQIAFHCGSHRGLTGAGNPLGKIDLQGEIKDLVPAKKTLADGSLQDTFMTGFNIHWGPNNVMPDSKVNNSSLGCQVIACTYDEFKKEISEPYLSKYKNDSVQIANGKLIEPEKLQYFLYSVIDTEEINPTVPPYSIAKLR